MMLFVHFQFGVLKNLDNQHMFHFNHTMQMTMALAPMILALLCLVIRGFKADTNRRKYIGVVSGIVGILFTGFALMAFGAGCYSVAPGTIAYQSYKMNLTKHIGGGMALALFSFVAQLVSVIIHVIVPTSNVAPTENTNAQSRSFV
jgi:hypothetical protein